MDRQPSFSTILHLCPQLSSTQTSLADFDQTWQTGQPFALVQRLRILASLSHCCQQVKTSKISKVPYAKCLESYSFHQKKPHFCLNIFNDMCTTWQNNFYSAPVGERSIAISLSVCVCVSVCPWAYLWNCWTNLHEIFCADPVAVARSSSGDVAIRHVFQFYGWRHVWL